MKDSVREIIGDWHTTITIMQPLPLNKQPNYNSLMREFTGDVLYNTITVPAERKDIVSNNTNLIDPKDSEYGENNAGTLLYAIPNIIPVIRNGKQVGVKRFKPNKDSTIIIDSSDDRYYIYSMRSRIGETLIAIRKHVGDIPNGTDIIDRDNIPIDGLADPDTILEEQINEDISISADTNDNIGIKIDDDTSLNIEESD